MNSSRKSRFILAGVSVLSLGGVIACGSPNNSSSTNASQANSETSNMTLTIYNGQHKETIEDLAKEFEKKTGIHVNLRNGDSNELADQIIEEGQQSPADIITTEESPPLSMLAKKGLLAKVPKEVLQQVPSQYSSEHGDWLGVTARTRMVVYNPKMISEKDLPRSVLDFALPKWQGKVGYVATSGSFLEQVTAIMELDGKQKAKQWLEGLKKYGKNYNGNAAALEAVSEGAVATALINSNTWFREEQEVGKQNMKTKIYRFGNHDPGDLITISGDAILKTSQHKQAAAKFLEFVVSEQAQEVSAKTNGQYPLRSGMSTYNASSEFGEYPFARLSPPPITPAKLGTDQRALELEQEVGLS